MCKKFYIVYGLLICWLFWGCEQQYKKENENNPEYVVNIKQMVKDWNKAHTTKDVGVFSGLFDNSVLFYGVQQEKNRCIENKLEEFKKHPDFFQQIYGEIVIEHLSDSLIKCNFVKRVTINQSTKDYASYLIFKKISNNWRIITESDLLTDSNLAKQEEKKKKIPKDAVKGDFNGDGKEEYMWIVPPKIGKDGMSCIGDCISYIKFSDSAIPSIKIENCIGGNLLNLGDLNKNKTDEIGLWPDWFSSCWRSYKVWTLLDGKWKFAVDPFEVHCDQWDSVSIPVVVDPKREGYVIIRYSEFTDEGLVKSKSVKIAK